MFDPVKYAFARCIMHPYRDHLAVTTPQMREFVTRRFDKACQFAQTRMIDQAEAMIEKYLRTDRNKDTMTGDSPPTRPHLLPVIIVAFARDYAPTGRDYTRQIADMEYVILPGDKKERVFGLRTAAGDLRVQIAFFAREEPTAKSMAAQFLLFLDETPNRRFFTRYRFAGLTLPWPVQIESPETPAMNIATDAQNLNILTVDLTLKCTVPLFYAPGPEEENDGKGIPGDDVDPAGYPLVNAVRLDGNTLDKGRNGLDLYDRIEGEQE